MVQFLNHFGKLASAMIGVIGGGPYCLTDDGNKCFFFTKGHWCHLHIHLLATYPLLHGGHTPKTYNTPAAMQL